MKFKNKGLRKILKLIQTLDKKDSDISTRSIKNVSQILNVNFEKEKLLRNFFLSKGIPIERHDQLFDHIVKNYSNISEIENLLLSNTKIKKIINKSDTFYIQKIFPNLSVEFIKSMINYRWAGSPSIGCGEIFLALSIKDAKKPIKGDLQVKDDFFEIKSNSARLRGQKYCLDTFQTHEFINATIKECLKAINLKSTEIDLIVNSTSFNKYNLNKSNFFFLRAFKIMYQHAKEKKHRELLISKFIKIIDRILGEQGFSVQTSDYLINTLESEFLSMTTTDKFYRGFVKCFVYDSFKRYFKEENIKTIIFLNTDSLTGLVITSDNLEHHLDNFSFKMPSLSVKSGPQGTSVGVTLL